LFILICFYSHEEREKRKKEEQKREEKKNKEKGEEYNEANQVTVDKRMLMN
jgi:hypothetical protein